MIYEPYSGDFGVVEKKVPKAPVQVKVALAVLRATWLDQEADKTPWGPRMKAWKTYKKMLTQAERQYA